MGGGELLTSEVKTITPYIKDNYLFLKGLSTSVEVSLYNLMGTNVKTIKNVTDKAVIPIYSLASGIYIIKVITPEGKIQTLKIRKDLNF